MNDPHDLDWLAFQYIADELPPEEAAAFELRLADDQAAREAVARAVEVSQAAAAFELEPVVSVAPATPARWSALWWMACGAAACLAAVAAFHLWPTGQGARPMASPDLARAWSEARDHVPAGPDLASEVRGLVDGDAAELSEPDSRDHATPSWLMAALSDDDMDGTPAMDDEMLQTPPGKKGEG